MFTGIIQTQAKIIALSKEAGILRLIINVSEKYAQNLNIGASIAINGCCLTVVKIKVVNKDTHIYFDVIEETLTLTNLGMLTIKSVVNFERSVTFGTELGGHIVSGHIHCMAKVNSIIKEDNNCNIQLNLPKKWAKYVLYKGFISINGVSLTVGEVDVDSCWLHLIPETLAVTNLGTALVGEMINIEVDQQTYAIINTVENYMKVNT
jgi:riboflavin synthase